MSESNWEASRECLRRAKEARRFIDAPTTTPTERGQTTLKLSGDGCGWRRSIRFKEHSHPKF
jgi:hypothetical protein